MANVATGSVVQPDGWMGYARLLKKGYEHRPWSQRAAKREGNPEPIMLWAHRAISNFKSSLRGTHRSVSAKHLQVYLDEFTFRYNRRATTMVSFQRLLGLESHQEPTTLRQIEEAAVLIETPNLGRWEGRRDRALLVLALQTGLRVSELIGLDCSDVLLGAGRSRAMRRQGS